MSILLAATYPDRVTHLVIYGSYAGPADWAPGEPPVAATAEAVSDRFTVTLG